MSVTANYPPESAARPNGDRSIRSRWRAGLAVVGLGALVSTSVLAFAEPAAAADPVPWSWSTDAPATVTADPLPTVQIDGVAWTQAIVGNTVYVGGEFQNARPAGAAAGTQLTPRSNLLAYNLQTGALITTWNPGANAEVREITASPDGSRIYVGGAFTTIGGQTRYHVAAFETVSGALISTFKPVTNGTVSGLKATANTVFLVGPFTSVNSAPRSRLGAVDALNGSVKPLQATIEGGYGTKSIVVSPDGGKIVISGSFESVNGSTNPGRGIAALDSTNGTLMPWLMNSVVRNAGGEAAFVHLNSDGDSVYGTGFDYGGGPEDDFEGTFRASWSDGTLIWMTDCHGDTYGVYPMGDVIYTSSHAHYCGNIGAFPQTDPWTMHHSLAFSKAPTGQKITPDIWGYRSFTGQQAPTLLHWYPDWVVGSYTTSGQAAWQVTGNSQYVLYAGEFTGVAGKKQQGLVRFAKPPTAPDKIGPRVSSTKWVLSGNSIRSNEIRLRWTANNDPDDSNLTYQVLRRDRGTTPLWTGQVNSNFWTTPVMSYRDTTVVAGQSYEYRIKVLDPHGNTTGTEWTAFTASTGVVGTAYDDAVIDDNPVDYWPLGEASGSTAFDWSGVSDLTLGTGATRAVAGPNLTTATNATRFSGTGTGRGVSTQSVPGPQVFTVEAWFKTDSNTGGKIVGFGSSASTANSGSYDRHVYLEPSGRVTFGLYPGGVRTVTSTKSYNDNAWHHVVASLGLDGQTLYVDGERVSHRDDVTSAQSYNGYWHVGGDNIGGWPNTNSFNLNGSISNVAVYDRVLTRDEIDLHWGTSGRAPTGPAAPADSYGKAVTGLDPDLYWRLAETSGTVAADSSRNGHPATYAGTIQKNVPGALVGVSNPAARFNSVTTGGLVASSQSFTDPRRFSVEAWFQTTTNAGGKIIGFGDRRTGTSTNSDRHVYMTTDGAVNFGVWSGAASVLTSQPGLNNGQWHHVVASMSGAGMRLYIDGSLVGQNSNTVAQPYTGYWRVGGDTSWAGATWFPGSIDEVAVYPTTLTAVEVLDHWSLGTSGTPNEAPIPAFTAGTSGLDVDLDASASDDPDGTIESWTWDFGDGSAGSGETVSHHYAAGGAYTVTLTVEDNRGVQRSLAKTVTVTAPNQLPTASFTLTATNLSVAADGSASSDPDGSIASYSWNFGDGTPAETGVTRSHVYGTGGTYTVTLTVTDNRGGTATSSHQVTVSPAPNQPPTAAIVATTAGLTVSLDGSGSTDPDGSVSGYTWDFGDGSPTATGASQSHTYASDGAYTVTLTVSDNRGATDSETTTVNVAGVPSTVLATDDFTRVSASGWGTSQVGGAWTHAPASSTARFTVDGSSGILSSPTGTYQASLQGVSSTRARITAEFSVDKVVEGHYIALVGRQVGVDQYIARVRIAADGSAKLYILQNANAVRPSFSVPDLVIQPGQKYTLSLEVTGTGTTTLSAKVWKSGAAEPAWQVSGPNTFAALQQPGYVGFFSYLPGTAAALAPVKVGFDNLQVVDPAP
jgi:PKD repeat protein